MQNYNGKKKFYYGKRDGKKQSLTKFSGETIESVRTLIANVIGEQTMPP